MIGAGAVSFFGTYTYMPKFVGPSLKAVTFVMLWQLPSVARAKVANVVRSCILSVYRLLLVNKSK
jgi:hypothetical protein